MQLEKDVREVDYYYFYSLTAFIYSLTDLSLYLEVKGEI